MKLGRPEDYHNNIKIRLMAIERAIAQYQFSAQHHKATFQNKIDEHTKLFIRGLGNEINFLSAFKELFFNSRELLDILLLKLNKVSATRGVQTARHFLPFAKQMMKGNYDNLKLSTIDLLKTNITYIFHIRKIRNEIKNSPSKILFRYNDRFEAYFIITINPDEKELIPFIEIANKEEALKNMSYNCVYILDNIFPEMLQFWQTCLAILDKDIKALTIGSTATGNSL
jgi:hypothetical protein